MCQADALAQQHREDAIPPREHAIECGALGTARSAHEKDAHRGLQLSPGAGQQGVRGVSRDAQEGGDLGNVQPLRHLQDDDVALAGVQAAQCGAQQGTQLGALGVPADVGRLVRQVGRLVERGRAGPVPQPAQALVAGHGEQPRPQSLRVAQARQPGGRDEVRVLDRVGRVGRLA